MRRPLKENPIQRWRYRIDLFTFGATPLRGDASLPTESSYITQEAWRLLVNLAWFLPSAVLIAYNCLSYRLCSSLKNPLTIRILTVNEDALF